MNDYEYALMLIGEWIEAAEAFTKPGNEEQSSEAWEALRDHLKAVIPH